MKASQKELNASSDRLEIAELTYETGSGCLGPSTNLFNRTDYWRLCKIDFVKRVFLHLV